MTLTSEDFENLGERTQAFTREVGLKEFAALTGLSQRTGRRFLRDPQAIMRSGGATGVIVIMALRKEQDAQKNASTHSLRRDY